MNKLIDIVLSDVQCRFENNPDDVESVEMTDKVLILDIKENESFLQIERNLIYMAAKPSYAKVIHYATLVSDAPMSKADISILIKEGFSELYYVLAKASLVLSEITNAGPLGAVITPPSYDCEEIEIC